MMPLGGRRGQGGMLRMPLGGRAGCHGRTLGALAIILALLVGGTALSLHSNRKAAAAQPAPAASAQPAPPSSPRASSVRVPPSVTAPTGADPYSAQRPDAASAA